MAPAWLGTAQLVVICVGIPMQGDVYVIDNVLDRRQLLPPGTPGSAAATSASLSQALQTLIQLPQAEADAAKLRGGANAPELAVAG